MSHPEFPTSLSGVQGLEEKYDYEIAFDDLWIGKIWKTLEETKLAQNTAIVVFGDHGEAWGEHKIFFHGQMVALVGGESLHACRAAVEEGILPGGGVAVLRARKA